MELIYRYVFAAASSCLHGPHACLLNTSAPIGMVQRKRLSLAVELVANPAVIFMVGGYVGGWLGGWRVVCGPLASPFTPNHNRKPTPALATSAGWPRCCHVHALILMLPPPPWLVSAAGRAD